MNVCNWRLADTACPQHDELQLLHLHEKSVRQGWEQPHRRKRRGESEQAYAERLRAMWSVEKRREAEDAALRRAARFEESGEWRLPEEAAAPPLPPLHLVTGWSRAGDGAGHNPDVALFGGWRIAEMHARQSDTSAGARKK